jgi:type II secretory pathway pseudopilin PulG
VLKIRVARASGDPTDRALLRRARPGFAILVALIVVVLVVALGLAYLGINVGYARTASAARAVDQAQHIADAALDQARRFLFVYRDEGTWSWNEILQYNAGFSSDPVEVRAAAVRVLRGGGAGGVAASTWPEAPVPANRTVPASLPTVFGVHTQYGKGAWYTVIRNNPEDPDPFVDTDDTLLVIVIATMPDGEQRGVEAQVKYDPPAFTPQGAILSNGSLKIGGSVAVKTSAGTDAADVYVNANSWIEGDGVKIEGRVAATGSIDVEGSPSIRDGIAPGSPRVVLPVGNPEAYRSYATHVFRSDGTVTDAYGTPLGVGTWNDFRFASGGWSTTGGRPPAGAYFFETDLSISGNGTFRNTFIAAGSIAVSGTPAARPDITPFLDGVSFLAGGDLRMTGNAEIRGFAIAREQLFLRGNIRIVDGGAIALDEFDRSSVVSTTSEFENSIEGNPTIVYKGGTSTFLHKQVYSLKLEALRRIR